MTQRQFLFVGGPMDGQVKTALDPKWVIRQRLADGGLAEFVYRHRVLAIDAPHGDRHVMVCGEPPAPEKVIAMLQERGLL